MDDLQLDIPFYMIAFFAVIGNLLVLYNLYSTFKTFRSATTRFILLLHTASILEGISSLPYIYLPSPPICQLMGAFHYYFGLVIIGVDLSLTLLFYNFLILNDAKIERRLSRYGILSILCFAWISFLPFTTGSYGINNEVWCSLDYYNSQSNIWSFTVYYAESLVAFTICFIALAYLLYFIRKYDKAIQKDILLSAGSYILITLVSLGPRLIPRLVNLFIVLDVSEDGQFFIQGSIYLASLLYILCYYRNAETLRGYEAQQESQSQRLLSFSSFVDSLNEERVRSVSETRKTLWLQNLSNLPNLPKLSNLPNLPDTDGTVES